VWLLNFPGPEFRFGVGLFLVGRPDRIARLGKLLGDALDLRGDAVRVPCAVAGRRGSDSRAAALAQEEDLLVGSSPNASACSRTSDSTSESGTSIPSWSAAASSTSSRPTEARRLSTQPLEEIVGGLPVIAR